MKSTLRNLAIALLLLTITVLAWLTDPTQENQCGSINDDVAGVLLSDSDDAEGMEARALGAASQCQPADKSAETSEDKTKPKE